MSRFSLRIAAGGATALAALALWAGAAQAGPHGSELDLSLMPAAGGMEGVGIVRPQTPVSMLFGNPSTMAHLKGKTSFVLGGSYISPDLEAKGNLATPGGLLPFEGQSRLEDLAAPHAAVLQRLSPNLVAGMGITAVSGLGSDFRRVFPAGFGLTADLKIFGMNMGAGYQVSPNLSVGMAATIAISSFQVGTVDSTASVNNFGIGGTFGVNYDAGPIMIGMAYRSPLRVKYTKVVRTDPNTLSDFVLTQPQEFSAGFATTDMTSERFFVEFNYRFKNYSDAAGYKAFWRDQHVFLLGGQYKLNDMLTMRAGYSFNTKIATKTKNLGNRIGGLRSLAVPGFPDFGFGPGAAPISPGLIQLFQATLADGHWQQGVSGGMGVQIMPFLRLDINVQLAFDGKFTFADPNSPQVITGNGTLFSGGMGFTWTF